MESVPLEAIAIVGFAATLPYAQSTADDFWESICRGESAWGQLPAERFDVNGFYHPDKERLDTLNCKHGYFLKQDPYEFDAPFFRISPSEAAAMDPRHRGLMECTFHALENSGMTMRSVAASNTSVFVANSGAQDYSMILNRDRLLHSKYSLVGQGGTMAANRISHFFDLRGPSMTLDTACSSSLYALHLGCQSIRLRESRMSIIGASNLIMGPDGTFMSLSNGGFLSDDGVSYCFDERASGYARGEGLTVLVLKSLRDAIQAGDPIRSVIRSTAANASGKSIALTQPSAQAHVDLIRKAYNLAGLDLADTQYFEAHSTGTRVGDPIESKAIGSVFNKSRVGQKPLLVGSVKANIGHLEAASGLASVFKAIYMLERGLIPPNINLDKVSSNIDTELLGIEFPRKLMAWPTEGIRRISINSFGFGGSNAHAILDDAYTCLARWNQSALHFTLQNPILSASLYHNKHNVSGPAQTLSLLSDGTSEHLRPQLLPVSAADEAGLKRQLQTLHSYLKKSLGREQLSLSDIAFTLGQKRNKLQWRSYLIAQDVADVENAVLSNSGLSLRESSETEINFLFTGQGVQWCTMGSDLLCYAPFHTSIMEAEAYLHTLGCPWSVKDELLSGDHNRLSKSDVSQPLCTILQVALVDLLSDWGIEPNNVVGHSSGEIAAAYACGAFSKQTAWALAYYRGLSACKMSSASSDAQSMMAVALAPTEGRELLSAAAVDEKVSIACVNSPTSITVSGEAGAIEKFRSTLEARGTFAKKLPVEHAYHSSYMNSTASVYAKLVKDLFSGNFEETGRSVCMFSSVTGESVSCRELATAKYWIDNLLLPVQFSDALSSVFRTSKSSNIEYIFLEIGPHPALKRYAVETFEMAGLQDRYTYLPLLRRDSHEPYAINAAGCLWAKGVDVDLSAINSTATDLSPKLLIDFPLYEFNHDQAYRLKSRLVDAVSYHSHVKNVFVGLRDVDWTPRRASWRNLIDINEVPWVKDHRFGETAVYPAAGFLVMAMEACRQLINNDKLTSGFRFRNVVWARSLHLSEQENETRIYLQSDNDAAFSTEVNFNFWIYGTSFGDWVDLCHGSIRAELWQNSEPTLRRNKAILDKHHERISKSGFEVHHQRFYQNLHEFGIQYGPAFSILRGLKYSRRGDCCGILPLEMCSDERLPSLEEPLVIHPAALDALIHLPLVDLSEGSWKRIPPIMATRIDDIWLSSSLLKMAGHDLVVSAELTKEGVKDRTWNATAVSADTALPVIIAEGLTGTALQSFAETDDEQGEADILICPNRWLPDLHINTREEIQDYFDRQNICREPEFLNQLDQRVYQYLERALSDVVISDTTPKHLRRYLHLMSGELEHRPAESKKQIPLDTKADEALLKVVDLVGNNLPNLFSGEVDPLQLLFEDSTIMEDFYRSAFKPAADNLSIYFDVLAHNNPQLAILEVGAGTGFASRAVIESLSTSISELENCTKFSRFVYTDISSAFFEHARSIFSEYEHRMEFRTLDIAQDPIAQGFEEGSFDVILAAAVIHAAPCIAQSLNNLRLLLKPGGVLIMVEQSGPRSLTSNFVSGLLPSFWLAEEEFRKGNPLISERDWNRLLKETGFTGIDIAMRDSRNEQDYVTAVLVSHKLGLDASHRSQNFTNIQVILDHDSPLQSKTAQAVKETFSRKALCDCALDTLEEVNIDAVGPGSLIICLLDLDGDIFDNIAPASFLKLQSILLASRKVMWTTQGSSIAPFDPKRAKVEGFGRTLCSERSDLSFSVVAFDNDNDCSTDFPAKLLQIMLNHIEAGECDLEPIYAEKDNIFYTSRADPSTIGKIVKRMTEDSNNHRPVSPSKNAHSAFQLEVKSAGLLDTLTYVEQSLCSQDLLDDEVEVEVMFSSLNFKDILIALGQFSSKNLGFDAVGMVRRAGADSGFQEGDRVCCCVSPAIATIIRCKAQYAVLVPQSLPSSLAATVPTAFSTAYHCLLQVAMLQPAESVLIHSAAGGVGQFAVQIAQFLGASIFATAGTPQKRLMLHERYGIPLSNIFSSRDSCFAEGIMAATNGSGVDVVLNSVAGDLLQASFDILAPFGRFLEIGKQDIKSASKLGMCNFDKNVTFAAIDLSVIWTRDRQRFSKILKDAMDLIAKNLASFPGPEPLHIFPAKNASQAFRALQSGRLYGKVLVSFERTDDLQVIRQPKLPELFATNATYIVSGGFGGIGRSIVYWMIQKGAKHIVVLSRSGPKPDSACQQLFRHASDHGAELVSATCDISLRSEVSRVVKQVESRMPPIKGCFQSAMVLKDRLFHKMSPEDFLHPFGPKVAGSWNLHISLPPDLDFFIILSSIAGSCGSPGQTNYAAANSYQDALARYRVANGLKAFSLDLGLVLGCGYAAENFDVTFSLERIGYSGVTERQILVILEKLCDPNLSVPEPQDAQIGIGLTLPRDFQKAGKDIPNAFRRQTFSHLNCVEAKDKYAGHQPVQTGNTFEDLRDKISNATSEEQATEDLLMAFQTKVATAMNIPKSDVSVKRPLFVAGVDSLLAVELRTWFLRTLKIDMPVNILLSEKTVEELGHKAIALFFSK